MSVDELVKLLEEQMKGIVAGAKALADRLAEKKKQGNLTPREEAQWHDAIYANVKRAEELRRDVEKLRKLLA